MLAIGEAGRNGSSWQIPDGKYHQRVPASDPFTALRFAIGGVSQAIYPAGATFGPRTLIDFEFVWVVDGDVVWESDGRSHAIPRDALLLGRPGMRDAFTWDPRRPTRHGFLHFAILAGTEALPAQREWPRIRNLGEGDILRPLLRHLAWLQSLRPTGWERLAEITLAQVLVGFIGGATGTLAEESAGMSPIVDRVIAHVRGAWADGRLDQFSVPHLARIAGVSRGHLIRVFRGEFGVGPAEALRLLRLDRAAVLLARTNLQVQEIAAQCGFVDAFHFTRAFKAAYGHSPRVLRQRCAEGHAVPTVPLARVRGLSERVWR